MIDAEYEQSSEYFRRYTRLKSRVDELYIALEQGEISDTGELAHKIIETCKRTIADKKSDKYDLEFPTSTQILERIKKRGEGLFTGYKELDDRIRIPIGAITIIAGRPSHGKTTMLINLLVNMLTLQKNKSFLFFSYEEEISKIYCKLIAILSGVVISPRMNISQIEYYLKGDNATRHDRPNIEKAKNILNDLIDTKRLILIDRHFDVNELSDIIKGFNEKQDIGTVFIDYIQKIKSYTAKTTRQVELQRISEKVLETAIETRLPVIMGAQLGRDPMHPDKVRLDNLREAGDIEQDANLVIGIKNPYIIERNRADKNESGFTNDATDTNLEISILKNRDGAVGGKTNLLFKFATLQINDFEKGEDYNPF